MTSRRESAPVSKHGEAVHAQGDAAVRRRAELERVEEEAELLPRLLLGDAQRGEDLGLHLRIVEADAPAADLEAVEDDVVAVALHPARVRLEERASPRRAAG